MTKLMTAPFERFDSLDMRATFYQGTIFLEEDYAAKMSRNVNSTAGYGSDGRPNDLFPYMGYKFESLCLIPDTWDNTSRDFIEGRETHVVSNKAQYCSIVRTGIGECSIIMGGEVDAGTLQDLERSNANNPDKPLQCGTRSRTQKTRLNPSIT